MGFMFGESLCASLVIPALGHLSWRGTGGGSWTNDSLIERCLLAILGKKWEPFGATVRNQGGEQGFHSSLSLASKPRKKSLLPYTSELPHPRRWDHPTYTKGMFLPSKTQDFRGSQLSGLPRNFHCGYPGFLSYFP